MIGFFITLAITLFATLVCLWRCWIKDMVEEFIDDLFCCGYGNVIKDCYSWCCLCFSLVNDDSTTDEGKALSSIPVGFSFFESIGSC